MRNIGYHFINKNEITGEMNFVNPVGSGKFPRFDTYMNINKETGEFYFDLHLDQKAPIYRGVTAHSGEYTGKTIEKEAERIKKLLKNESID